MRRAAIRLGSIAAVVGLGATAVGWWLDAPRASFSYLFAWAFVFSVAVGSLFLLMIGHASDAHWFVAVRRLAEHATGGMPLVALAFVPVLACMGQLYPWLHPSRLPPHDRELVSQKLAWLNAPHFIGRSILYLVICVALGELLRRWSLQQDERPARAEHLRRRMIALSAPGLPVLALTLTFASFDWFMSLEPTWVSNLYGVYVFAGGFVAALGLFGVLLVLARLRGALPAEISVDHYYALGRLELAMVIFWTYIAWSQLLLYWIADLPLEVTWYIARWHGGWQWVGVALLVLHWAVPFFLLLQRSLKRHSSTLLAISAWLLLVHAIDIYYLILPAFEPGRLSVHALDFTALLGLVGASVAFGAFRAGGVRMHPIHDPALEESLHYEAAE
jgi:hypothetical protein